MPDNDSHTDGNTHPANNQVNDRIGQHIDNANTEQAGKTNAEQTDQTDKTNGKQTDKTNGNAGETGAVQAKICPKCSRPHGQCGAHNRKGGPCEHGTKGKPVCWLHGGKSPQVIAKWERDNAVALAARTMVTYGRAVDDANALQELVSEIARTAGHVRWLGKVIEDLDPEALVWNTTETVKRKAEGFNAVSYKDVSHSATPSVWITLYQTERAHLINACKTAIQCGVAERQIRLAEQQGELIAAVVRAVLNDPDLGLTAEQQAQGLSVASRHLRVVGE